MCALVSPPAPNGIVVFGDALACMPFTTISALFVDRPLEGGYHQIGIATRGGARMQWSLFNQQACHSMESQTDERMWSFILCRRWSWICVHLSWLLCSLLYSLDVSNCIPASCTYTCTHGLPPIMKISGKLLTCYSPLKKHMWHEVINRITESMARV
jgi:hypothetical protein